MLANECALDCLVFRCTTVSSNLGRMPNIRQIAVTNLAKDLGYQWATTLLAFIALAMTPFRKRFKSTSSKGVVTDYGNSHPLFQIWQKTEEQIALRSGVVAQIGRRSYTAPQQHSSAAQLEAVSNIVRICFHASATSCNPNDRGPTVDCPLIFEKAVTK